MKASFTVILHILITLLFTNYSMALFNLYDQMKTDVINLNERNFASQIKKPRTTGGVSIIHYYTGDDGQSEDLKSRVEDFAKQVKGIFKVGAINCEGEKSLCQSEGILESNFPVFRMYPPLPIPHFDYQGEFDSKKMKKIAAQYIQTPTITEITNNNIEALIQANNGIPLSLLFTKSKGIPLLYKALAKDFKDTMIFGIVRQDQTDLMDKFKIKQVPSLLIVEDYSMKKQPMRFQGKFNHQEAFQFLNSKSQVFITGDKGKMGGKQIISLKQKPWLQQKLPQLGVQSEEQLCFGLLGEGNNICMILVADQMPNDELVKTLNDIRYYYDPKIEGRGTKLRLSFLDLSVENEWKELFEIKDSKQSLVFIKGKKNRLRYYKYQGDLAVQNLSKLIQYQRACANLETAIDSMMGGSVKFHTIKQKPNFVFTFEQQSQTSETDL